jgi:hypothetical protein
MFFLKFIFYSFLFLFILGIVASFFLKRAFRRVAKNLENNMNKSQEDTSRNSSYRKTTRSETSGHKEKGEYVDFEEIKE